MALTISQTERIGYLLRHTADVLHRQLDQALLEQLGIGLSQLRLMIMLQHYPGAAQKQLASHLGQTEASISRQLKLLEADGLAEVAVVATEKRKHTAALTTKGETMAEAAKSLASNIYGKAVQDLNFKQRSALLESLDLLHRQTCQPGQPHSCDRPFDLLDIYSPTEKTEHGQH